MSALHVHAREPSPWIVHHAALVPAGAPVLDVAAGGGRHARHFLALGHPVVAVDRDVSGVVDLAADPRVAVVATDLEDGSPWPLGDRRFGGVVVVRYLHRPLLPLLVDRVGPGGVLLYETFAAGHETRGRPRNPDFLLRRDELLEVAERGGLRVVAYEHCEEPHEVVQRIAAVRAPA